MFLIKLYKKKMIAGYSVLMYVSAQIHEKKDLVIMCFSPVKKEQLTSQTARIQRMLCLALVIDMLWLKNLSWKPSRE